MNTHTGTHMSLLPEPLFHPQSHPSRSSQNSELNSLCYTAASRQLSILHMVVYRQCCSPSLSQLLLPPLCPHVHSLCLCLYFCPAHRLICTIFLDSAHTC